MAPPQCGAPDLTTFKSATSSEEQRAMHPDPEAAKRISAAAGLLYPPKAAAPFKEPDPKPSQPNPKDPGPDISSFQEWAPPSAEKDRRTVAEGGMKRSALSIGSQMWSWGSKTPPKSDSRESSQRGGNIFSRSRESSSHGGDAFATGMKRNMSNNSLSNLWNWTHRSPPESREASLHGGSLFKGPSREGSSHGGNIFSRLSGWGSSNNASPGMKRGDSVGSRLWSWATEPGQPEMNQMRKAKEGPDLSTFDAQGRIFDAQGKTHSVLSPKASVRSSPEALRPMSPDKTHTDRGV